MPRAQPVEVTQRRERALLEQRLRTERLDPRELRTLLETPDAELVHAVLLHLKRRLERLEGGDTPAGLLEALPEQLGACAPETQVLLAELARLLPSGLPAARLASLAEGGGPRPIEAEVAWLGTELLREPGRLAARRGDALLLQAVRSVSPRDALDVEAWVDALGSHPDAEVQLLGMAHLGDALSEGLLSLTRTLSMAFRALEATDPRVALRAAELLAEPWAARPEVVPSARALQKLLGRSERLAIAALRALARRGDSSVLRLALEDERQPRSVRREAMALLAPFAGHEELRLALLVTREEPLLFGPTCAALLQTLYRRGVRCGPEEVPLVRDLYLAHHQVSPAVIAEVLTTRQREYVDLVRDVSPEDADFLRHLALLRELDSPEVVGFLQELLSRPGTRPLWPEVIEALGHLGHESSEEVLLRHFDSEPWACLGALRRVGGQQTVRFLRSRADAAVPWRDEALRVVVALEDSPADSSSWLTDTEPDPAVLASLQPVYDKQSGDAVGQLASHVGHPLRLQAIAQLGRDARCSTFWTLGDLLLEEDEAVQEAARTAIIGVGRNLHARGSARPRCLLSVGPGEDAGALVLTDVLLDQLEPPGHNYYPDVEPSDAQFARVLGQLVGRKHPALARRVRHFLRHESVQLQKLALECLVGSGDPRVVAWLVPFAGAEDIYRLRQALTGFGVFGVEWAVPLLVAGLEHPNMNIKKTAAEALGRVGHGWPAPVGVLLDWLRRHDNPGLRELLVRALRATCGRGYVATVLDALQKAATPREQALLAEALSGVLSPRAIVALASRGEPVAHVLVDAAHGGGVVLGPDGLDTLEALLRRHGLEHLVPGTSEDFEQRQLLRALQLDADLAWLDDVLSSGDEATLEAAREDLTKLLSSAATAGLTGQRAAILKRHLDMVRGLLDSPSPALRRLSLSLLDALAGSLSGPEKLGALSDVRRALAASRLEPHEVFPVMRGLGAVLSLEEARVASALPDARLALWGAEHLVLAGGLVGSELLGSLLHTREPGVRRFYIPFALRALPPVQVLEAVARGPHPEDLETVRKQWPDVVPEDALVEALVHSAEAMSPASASPLVGWLRDVGTEGARAALRRLARHPELALALESVDALGTPASEEDAALFGELSEQGRPEVRRRVARHLWSVQGLPHLQRQLLGAAEERSREVKWLPAELLGRRELASLLTRVEALGSGPEAEDFLEALLGLLERGGPRLRETPESITLMLGIWERGAGRSATLARDGLRSIRASRVLPFILTRLRQGHTAVLDVLGSDVWWGPELVKHFAQARGIARTHFLELLQRGIATHAVEGPGLSKVLLDIIAGDEAHRVAAQEALGGLGVWGTGELFRVADWLIFRANKFGEAAAFQALRRGLARLGPEVRASVLTRVDSPLFREDVVADLALLVVEDPSLEKMIPKELLPAVRRRLEVLAWESPEPHPKALEAAARQPTPQVIDRLTRLLSHRKSWVRLRAHRLLRALVPREHYLELTREVLKDPIPGHVVRAIRVLAFGRHRPAVAELAALLNDRRNPVARAARDGLIVMGDTALPILRSELAHARPDRRALFAQVIASLEKELGGAGAA
ncbi:HEAT repeat domain-containing protein [Pyxidicoccus sp. 3LG]